MRRIYVILIILVLAIALVFVSMKVTDKIQAKVEQDKNNQLGIATNIEQTMQEEGNEFKYYIDGELKEEHSMKVTSKMGYSMEYMDDLYHFSENELYNRFKFRTNSKIYMTIEIYRQYDKIDAYFDVKENDSEKVMYKKGNNRIYKIEMFYPEEDAKQARETMLKMIETFKIL